MQFSIDLEAIQPPPMPSIGNAFFGLLNAAGEELKVGAGYERSGATDMEAYLGSNEVKVRVVWNARGNWEEAHALGVFVTRTFPISTTPPAAISRLSIPYSLRRGQALTLTIAYSPQGAAILGMNVDELFAAEVRGFGGELLGYAGKLKL